MLIFIQFHLSTSLLVFEKCIAEFLGRMGLFRQGFLPVKTGLANTPIMTIVIFIGDDWISIDTL